MSAMNAPTSASGKGLWPLGVGLLALGVLLGRAIFPLEVPKPFVVEKRVEVPVEVVKYVDRILPVEKMACREREPREVGVIGTYVTWHNDDNVLGGNVRFLNGKLRYWDEPSR